MTTLTVLSRPHPAAFARSFALDPDQSERSRHHRAMTPELTDRWWADDCAALRTVLARAGVPAEVVDGYMATFTDRAALDAAMNWYRAAAAEGDGLRAADINEVIERVGFDDARVNPNGGAIALGHPLGASGARLVMTAINQLHRSNGRYALCTMCIGVGQGIAVVVERV